MGDAAQSQLIESTDVNAFSLLLMFAAHHDGAGSTVAVLFATVGASIAVIGAANKSENVVWRYRTYCPNRYRQMSPKSSRPHSCSFGYNSVQASCRPGLSPTILAEPSNLDKFPDAAAAETAQTRGAKVADHQVGKPREQLARAQQFEKMGSLEKPMAEYEGVISRYPEIEDAKEVKARLDEVERK